MSIQEHIVEQPKAIYNPKFGKESSQKNRCVVTSSKVNKGYLGLKEASEYLGVAEKTLYNWVWQGKIPCYKPSKKKILFRIDELDEWMKKSWVAEKQ